MPFKDVRASEVVLTISWTSRFVFGINICVLVQMSDLREMRGNITETLGLNSAFGTGGIWCHVGSPGFLSVLLGIKVF